MQHPIRSFFLVGMLAFVVYFCLVRVGMQRPPVAPKFATFTNSAGEVYPLFTGEIRKPMRVEWVKWPAYSETNRLVEPVID